MAVLPSTTPSSCPTTPDSTSNSRGTATVSVQGGTLPYQYSWNTSPAQTPATATGLSTGTHLVTVKDGNGCVVADSVFVDVSSTVDLASPILSWEVSPNPSSGVLHFNVQLQQPEPVTLEVFDLRGKRVFQQKWEARQHIEDQFQLGSLPGSVYLIRVFTSKGQESREWIKE